MVQCKIPNSFFFQHLLPIFRLVRLPLHFYVVGYVPASPRMLAGDLHMECSRAANCVYLASVVDLALFIQCCRAGPVFILLWNYLGVALDHPGEAVVGMTHFSATCSSTMPELIVKSSAPTWYLTCLRWTGPVMTRSRMTTTVSLMVKSPGRPLCDCSTSSRRSSQFFEINFSNFVLHHVLATTGQGVSNMQRSERCCLVEQQGARRPPACVKACVGRRGVVSCRPHTWSIADSSSLLLGRDRQPQPASR